MTECICGCGIVIPDGTIFIPDEFHLMNIIDTIEKKELRISRGEVKLI